MTKKIPPRRHRSNFPPPSRPRVTVMMHWWEDRLFAGIARYASEHDWELDCRMRWMRSKLEADARRSDGLIIDVGLRHPLKSVAEAMHEAGVAIVGTQQVGQYPCDAQFFVPHEAVGRAGAEHLVELNFAHLLFVIFEDNGMERQRGAGFVTAGRAAGRDALEMPFAEFAANLPKLPRPLGLMACNDLNALEVMRVCLDANLRIPEECAIVGVDDMDTICRLAPVPLTSVNCNFEEQGYASAMLLDGLMVGDHPPPTACAIPPLSVTRRRSTDTLSLSDAATARALHYIRAHFREPIGIADVSENAGAPLRKLQDNFRRDVGRTMIEELTRLRVERAQLLMNGPPVKLDAVASECGFANRFHLARAFHRLTGLTPTEFRRQIARGEA